MPQAERIPLAMSRDAAVALVAYTPGPRRMDAWTELLSWTSERQQAAHSEGREALMFLAYPQQVSGIDPRD